MKNSLLTLVFIGTVSFGCHANATDVCPEGAVMAKAGQYQSAFQEWEKAALDDSPKEKLRADINCLRHNRIAVDDTAIAKWMMERADEGIPSAQLYTGMLFANGIGVKKSLVSARQWLKLADKNGHPDAAFLLQIMDEGSGDK